MDPPGSAPPDPSHEARWSRAVTDAAVIDRLRGLRTGSATGGPLPETLYGRRKMTAWLFKPRGPWRTAEQVEIAVLEWVDWYNHRRLHEHCGDIPPAELEAAHHRHTTDLAEAGSSTN